MTNERDSKQGSRSGVRWVLLLGCLAVGGAAGCRTTDPNVPQSRSLASITLTNQMAGDIRQTTIEVFKENRFDVTYAGVNNMVFEKPGGWMKNVAYGGWMDSDVWTRVKVDISQYATNQHLMTCDAYIVRDRGDTFFEEELRMYKISKGPYKKMLKTVQTRLHSR